jgi:hypothetical protein
MARIRRDHMGTVLGFEKPRTDGNIFQTPSGTQIMTSHLLLYKSYNKLIEYPLLLFSKKTCSSHVKHSNGKPTLTVKLFSTFLRTETMMLKGTLFQTIMEGVWHVDDEQWPSSDTPGTEG